MLLITKSVFEMVAGSWHWSVSGIALSVIVFLLIFAGKKFGISSSYKALCSMGGAGNSIAYFNYDWKSHSWLLMFVVGTIIGGGIAGTLLSNPEPVRVATATAADLQALGIVVPQTMQEGAGFLPEELFNLSALATLKGFIMIVLGGFLVGFGTRYAAGCTSGHAITGLSNLQLPSLVAVIGFFIGGLLMTHLLLPLVLSL